jgi:riboflavin transporter FmnP
MNVIFTLIYSITFFISFGLTIWFLEIIHFSWVSVIIFLFFLAFASFFIIRIRRTAKEWIVIDARENIMGFLIDFFSVPIVATGKWLSGKFARLNVFAFILDFIIEAPFKVLVEIAEQWTRYVRERKDEL